LKKLKQTYKFKQTAYTNFNKLTSLNKQHKHIFSYLLFGTVGLTATYKQ